MKRCYFAKEGLPNEYRCSAITDQCEGFNPSCKFYKTEEQYKSEKDKAIDRCRMLGRCDRCQYRDTPCTKSNEVVM